MVKEFRKSLILFLVICLVFSSFGFALAQGTDTKGHWAEDYLASWMENGLVTGYADGSVKPDKPITRAEFITLTNRVLGFAEDVYVEFKDVPVDAWYTDDISTAAILGYIGGYADGTMRPDALISRQEVATILTRLAELESNTAAANQFTDVIPTWSKGYIGAVVEAGLMNGYPNGTFGADQPITRAEAVVTLDRLLAYAEDGNEVFVVDEAGVYGPETGTEVIEGDVIIKVAGVTLQNLTITGDLIIAESVGEGDVFLEGVTVQGETYIKGGGKNSIHLTDTVLVNVIVDKKTGTVRIVATGASSVVSVVLQSNAIVEEGNLTGVGFVDVLLAASLPANSQVTLLGNFKSVDIEAASIALHIPRGSVETLTFGEDAKGSSLNLGAEARVLLAIIEAAVKLLGQGTIEVAEINASGVTYNKAPNKMNVQPGITPPQSNTSSGGGGGGGGGSDSGTTPSLSLSSDWTVNGVIANKHSGYFNNLNPKLQWTLANGSAKSYAIFMYDPDAWDFVHWVVKDIPASVTSIAEGVSEKTAMPGKEMTNYFGEIGYGGPTPPPGKAHTYHLTVYALNTDKLDLQDDPYGISKETFEAAIKGKVIASKTITGSYKATEAPTLTGITITTPATKTVYKVGDSLDISGLVVTGTYSNGSTKVETITTSNVSGFNSSQSTESQTLTITFGGYTATYTIKIVAVSTELEKYTLTLKSLVPNTVTSDVYYEVNETEKKIAITVNDEMIGHISYDVFDADYEPLEINFTAENGTVTGSVYSYSSPGVSLIVTTEPGYAFLKWTDEDAEEVSVWAMNEFWPDSDLNLTANFVVPKQADFEATGEYIVENGFVFKEYELSKQGIKIPLGQAKIIRLFANGMLLGEGTVESDNFLVPLDAPLPTGITVQVVTDTDEVYEAELEWTAPERAYYSFHGPVGAEVVFTEDVTAVVDFSQVTADLLYDWSTVDDPEYYAIALQLDGVDLSNVKKAFRIYEDDEVIEVEITEEIDDVDGVQYVTTKWQIGLATMIYVLQDDSIYMAEIFVESLTTAEPRIESASVHDLNNNGILDSILIRTDRPINIATVDPNLFLIDGQPGTAAKPSSNGWEEYFWIDFAEAGHTIDNLPTLVVQKEAFYDKNGIGNKEIRNIQLVASP